MKIKILFIAFFIALYSLLFGQSQSTLRGVVTDKSGETIIGGNVTIYKDKVKKLAAVTDVDGKYSTNIDAGTYDVEFSYLGLKTFMIKKVLLALGQVVHLDMIMQEDETIINDEPVLGCAYRVDRILCQDKTSSGFKLRAEEINRLPTRDIGRMVNMNQNFTWGY
jgi:TonB-dependent starch-binding outer membrane protein SusC